MEGSIPANVEAIQALGPSGGGITRAALADALARSLTDRNGLPNTRAGGAFAQAVAGNPAQAENLGAVTGAVNPSAAGKLGSALETFKASNTRRAEGSPTQANLSMEADIASGGAAARSILGGGSLRMTLDRLTGWAEKIGVEMHQDQIAKAVASNPAEAERLLQQMEQARGNTLQSRAAANAMRSFIGAQGANQ